MSDLARIDQSPDRLPADDPFRRQFQRLDAECRVIARSSLVPDSFKLDRNRARRPPDEITADLMLVALDCQKRGIPFSLTTLTKYAIVNGAAFPMGQILIGLVARHGHDLWIEERTPESVTVVLLNCRTDREHRSTYTMAEAKASSSYKKNVALGADKSVWLSHPMDMLTWRAVNRAIRIGAPDIAAGFGFEEPVELEPQWSDHPPAMLAAQQATDAPLPAAIDRGRTVMIVDPPATPEARERIRAAVRSLPPEKIAQVAEAWEAASLPPLDHPDFDTTDAVDANHLVLDAMATPAGRMESDGPLPPDGRTDEDATGRDAANAGGDDPGHPPPAPQSVAAARQDTAPGRPERGPQAQQEVDEPARPLAQQIAIQADKAGVDRHQVVWAVTRGAKTSGKDVDAEEGELVLLALADIQAGKLALVADGEGWKFAKIDQGHPFT